MSPTRCASLVLTLAAALLFASCGEDSPPSGPTTIEDPPHRGPTTIEESPPSGPFSTISTGGAHSCGITSEEVLYCWGYNRWGQLGIGTDAGPEQCLPVLGQCSTTPVPVFGGLAFASVTTDGSTTCGLTTSDAAYCWGLNNGTFEGPDLCQGSAQCSRVPVPVAGALTFQLVSLGHEHACGLTTSGAAYCWGGNGNGQLGNGDRESSTTPVAVSGGLSFASLSIGFAHTCGVTGSGTAYCWGGINGNGEHGNGTTTASTVPVAVSGGLTFASVSAGDLYTCGLTTGGEAYCWGDNGNGKLGNGTTTASTVPVAVSGGLSFASLSAASAHVCGLTTSGAAYCWGWNGGKGQLGNGTTTDATTPVAVAGGLTFTSVWAGGRQTCSLTTSSANYCWGDNEYGQLGDRTTTDRLTPVLVRGQ